MPLRANKIEVDAANEMAADILAAGFRVFIAEQGNYGCFTDSKGTRVVCFAANGLCRTVSGNYKTSNPKQTGTGWRISDDWNWNKVATYFAATPQFWAVKHHSWRYTTLSEYLSTYQASSRFTEKGTATNENESA